MNQKPNKPVMHIKLSDDLTSLYLQGKRLRQTLEKHYSDRFEVIFSPHFQDIKVDNMMVFNIGKDTDFDSLINSIEDYYSKYKEDNTNV